LVTNNTAAARVSEPCRATASKTRSCFTVIAETFISVKHIVEYV
jgi:hypothetical protein